MDKVKKYARIPSNGSEFEAYLSFLFEDLGYKVETTPLSGDYGADLIIVSAEGHRHALQAKFYNGSSIGLGAVQEVYASISHWGAQDGWVVTNGFFTDQAKLLAKENDIKLIDGGELNNLISQAIDGKVAPENRSVSSGGSLQSMIEPRLSAGESIDNSPFNKMVPVNFISRQSNKIEKKYDVFALKSRAQRMCREIEKKCLLVSKLERNAPFEPEKRTEISYRVWSYISDFYDTDISNLNQTIKEIDVLNLSRCRKGNPEFDKHANARLKKCFDSVIAAEKHVQTLASFINDLATSTKQEEVILNGGANIKGTFRESIIQQIDEVLSPICDINQFLQICINACVHNAMYRNVAGREPLSYSYWPDWALSWERQEKNTGLYSREKVHKKIASYDADIAEVQVRKLEKNNSLLTGAVGAIEYLNTLYKFECSEVGMKSTEIREQYKKWHDRFFSLYISTKYRKPGALYPAENWKVSNLISLLNSDRGLLANSSGELRRVLHELLDVSNKAKAEKAPGLSNAYKNEILQHKNKLENYLVSYEETSSKVKRRLVLNKTQKISNEILAINEKWKNKPYIELYQPVLREDLQ